MRSLSAKKRMVKGISITTIFFFISGLLANDVFAGFNSPLAPQSMFNQMDKFAPSDEGVNVIKDTFSLPAYLGEVREIHKGDSELFVIHIQDAHCDKGAQEKISEIIGYFNKEHGVKVVNLEGGSGPYDTGVFDAIKDRRSKKAISEYFVATGELNGAEHYAINNPGKVELWGIEKKEYYLENLKVYRDSMPGRKDVNGALDTLSKVYSELKKNIFSESLAKIDGYFTAYKAGNMDFRDYVDAIGKTAKAEGIDLKWFFNVFLLFQVTEMEADIDFRKADSERDTLMKELEKGLSIKEKEKLIGKSVAFKKKLIPEKQFYSFLLEKARYLEIDKTKFPNLFKYIVYVSIYEGIDYANLMTELDDLEIELKSKYFRNEEERALDKLSMDLSTLKNIFNVTLTKRDHEYYLANKASFAAENFIRFAKDNAERYGIKSDLPASINKLDGYREKMEGFFEYSFKRDAAFMENLKFPGESVKIAQLAKAGGAMGEEESISLRSCVLVTGGFHTDNMKALLKKNKISYISIIPKFKDEEGYESPYFRLLGGESAPFGEKINGLVPQASMIAIATKLCASGDADASLGELVYGKEGIGAFRLAVRILDALIRENGFDPEWIVGNIDQAGIECSGDGKTLTLSMAGKKKVTIDIAGLSGGSDGANNTGMYGAEAEDPGKVQGPGEDASQAEVKDEAVPDKGIELDIDKKLKERLERTRDALEYMDPSCMDWIVTPETLETEAGKQGVDREAARKLKKNYGSNTVVLGYDYGPAIEVKELAWNIALVSAEVLKQMARHVGTSGKPRAMVYIPKSVSADDIRDAVRMGYSDEDNDSFDELRGAFRASMAEILLAYGGKSEAGKGTPAEFEADLLMEMMSASITYVREGNIPDNAVIDEVNHVIAGKILLDRARKKEENKYKTDQDASVIGMLNIFFSGVFDQDGVQVDKLVPDILDMIMNGMYVINMVQPVDYEDIREVWEAQSEVLRSL